MLCEMALACCLQQYSCFCTSYGVIRSNYMLIKLCMSYYMIAFSIIHYIHWNKSGALIFFGPLCKVLECRGMQFKLFYWQGVCLCNCTIVKEMCVAPLFNDCLCPWGVLSFPLFYRMLCCNVWIRVLFHHCSLFSAGTLSYVQVEANRIEPW